MHKAAIAEWILSLVMKRERAVTTAGDLMETSALPALTALRIAGSAVVRDLWTSPGRTAALAALAFIVQFAICLPVILLLLIRVIPPKPLILLPIFFATQVLVGRWLARWSQGREMSACFALGMLNVAAGLMDLHTVSNNMALWQIPVVIGAVSARRLRLRRA